MTPARAARGAVLAVLVLLIGAAAAIAAPTFPPLTGRVVDQANILSPATEAQLTTELATLEQQTGRQMVVATISDLGGYEIEEYGYQLGRTWGIGQKGEDNGVVFVVAPNDRQVRIEIGYGLEPVFTDTLAFLILQEKVLPRFKAGEMEQGVVEGARAAIAQLSLPEDQAKAQVAAAQAQPAEGDASGIPVIVIIIFVFMILSVLGGGRRRRRGGLWWLWPIIFSGGGGHSGRGGGWSSGGGGWSSGGGGFSGGGGSFGGGGSSGRW